MARSTARSTRMSECYRLPRKPLAADLFAVGDCDDLLPSRA